MPKTQNRSRNSFVLHAICSPLTHSCAAAATDYPAGTVFKRVYRLFAQPTAPLFLRKDF